MASAADRTAETWYRASLGAVSRRPPLQSRIDAEVCIVGGGFAGLNTALGLCERGRDGVVLLEARELGHGASGRNGGFVFSGFSRGESDLLRDLGVDAARSLHAGTVAAVGLIRERARRYRIDCDLVDAGVLWANWFRDSDVLRARQRLLAEHFGVEWQWRDRDEVRALLRTARYHDALFEPDAFHFHPLKYAHGIAAAAEAGGARLYEDSTAPAGACARRRARCARRRWCWPAAAISPGCVATWMEAYCRSRPT
jgi:gamma-glutamylputrescine oxidase